MLYKGYFKVVRLYLNFITKAKVILEKIVSKIFTRTDWIDGFKAGFKVDAGIFALATVLSCGPHLTLIPPKDEHEQINRFYNDPAAIQEWINQKKRYEFDKDQFGGVFCDPNDKKCDVWASALTFLRSGKGDCDEVLALSHYSLGKSGIGLYLHDLKDPLDKEDDSGHAVYIYPSDNGLYGIISINESEWRPAKYESIEEAALSFTDSKYDYYKFINLPDEDHILLYSYEGIKDFSPRSRKFYFQKD